MKTMPKIVGDDSDSGKQPCSNHYCAFCHQFMSQFPEELVIQRKKKPKRQKKELVNVAVNKVQDEENRGDNYIE